MKKLTINLSNEDYENLNTFSKNRNMTKTQYLRMLLFSNVREIISSGGECRHSMVDIIQGKGSNKEENDKSYNNILKFEKSIRTMGNIPTHGRFENMFKSGSDKQ